MMPNYKYPHLKKTGSPFTTSGMSKENYEAKYMLQTAIMLSINNAATLKPFLKEF